MGIARAHWALSPTTVADGALMMSVIASGPDDRDRRTIPNDIQWTRMLLKATSRASGGLDARLGVRAGRSRSP